MGLLSQSSPKDSCRDLHLKRMHLRPIFDNPSPFVRGRRSIQYADTVTGTLIEQKASQKRADTTLIDFSLVAHLKRLWLSPSHVEGPIRAKVSHIPELEEVKLHGNRLSRHIPAQLDQLRKLGGLALHANWLAGPIPPGLGQLPNLRQLAVYNNQLTRPISPQLGICPCRAISQQSVSRAHPSQAGAAQFAGSVPPELGQLLNLQRLDLSNNQLEGPIPLELGPLLNSNIFRCTTISWTLSYPRMWWPSR